MRARARRNNVVSNISIAAPSTHISGVYSGVGSSGFDVYGNGQHGVHVDTTATRTTVGYLGMTGSSTVLSGNGLRGAYISAKNVLINSANVGVSAIGMREAGNKGGGILLNAYADFCTIGHCKAFNESAGVAHFPVLVSGNQGSASSHGVEIHGANTKVSNVWAGLASDGFTIVPNGGSGIYLGAQATGTIVGDTISGSTPRSLPTIIAGNFAHGVYSAADRTIFNHVWVGYNKNGTGTPYHGNHLSGVYIDAAATGATIGRRLPSTRTMIGANRVNGVYNGRVTGGGVAAGHGVVFAKTAVGPTIDGYVGKFPTVISGNNGYGVMNSAPSTNIYGSLIGVDASGQYQLNNRIGGIVLMTPATFSTIGKGRQGALSSVTVVSGNGGIGIFSAAPNTVIRNAYVGISMVAAGGAFRAVPNGGHGIAFSNTAQNSVVGGLNVGRVIISGNQGHGIYSNAPSTKVSNVYVGIGVGGTPARNAGAGIHYDLLASGSHVGVSSSWHRNTIVSGNTLDGIMSSAQYTHVLSCMVGLNSNGRPVPNGGNGITYTRRYQHRGEPRKRALALTPHPTPPHPPPPLMYNAPGCAVFLARVAS